MNLRGISSCAALAAALSAKYATYQEFDGDDLNAYLSHNGLLVSMCIDFNLLTQQFVCGLGKHERIFSASWIQRDQTAFRLFHVPQLPTGVGMVVDPSALEVQCLYPADGMTVQRDDLVVEGTTAKACGPVKTDPKYGSQGFDNLQKWKQVLIREGWNEYSRHFFQNNHSVACNDFFFQPHDGPAFSNQLFVKERNETAVCHDDRADFVYYDYGQFRAKDIEYIVKHKICESPNKTIVDDNNWLIYAGQCSWRPHQFNSMVRFMNKLDMENAHIQNWNEIVLDRPLTNLADVVQALFFVEWPEMDDVDRAYRNAIREAKKRNKHLFKVHWNDDTMPLFTCNISATEHASLA